MSNRINCSLNNFSPNYRPSNFTNHNDRSKLPSINNELPTMYNMNSSLCNPSVSHPCTPQMKQNNSIQSSSLYNSDYYTAMTSPLSTKNNCTPFGSIAPNVSTPLHSHCKQNRTSDNNNLFPKFSLSSSTSDYEKTSIKIKTANKRSMLNKNNGCTQRLMTPGSDNLNRIPSNMNKCSGQATVIHDRQLANEILQKAGISSNISPNDCLEVITDTPVTINDHVNCDPDPLCMKKPSECQECYEQSIVVRHLQPPRPPVPPPIIIRERCASQPPPQPPIVIRQIPPRPSTPPPLIIRECPPPMPDMQEPTIIEREVPAPPPPPRQVIIERLPAPPPKPRPIIVEKWLPYEAPEDRPCIVEKANVNQMPPPKNVIIQYEALEPKIQSQCIDEGVSCIDPKQFTNERSNPNAEICYVDQLNNLPDHIKCQLTPQALAAIGIQNDKQQNINCKPCVVRTNSMSYCQQQTRFTCPVTAHTPFQHSTVTNNCHSVKPACSKVCNSATFRPQQLTIRPLSTSTVCLPQCLNKDSRPTINRPCHQGFTNLARSHYNPWATTYQVSYTNKTRGLCRTR